MSANEEEEEKWRGEAGRAWRSWRGDEVPGAAPPQVRPVEPSLSSPSLSLSPPTSHPRSPLPLHQAAQPRQARHLLRRQARRSRRRSRRSLHHLAVRPL